MTPLIKKFAKLSGESEQRVEKLWDKAKAIVKKDYNIPEDSDRFYKLLVGILQKMLKIDEEIELDEEPSITTTTAGNVSTAGGSGNFAKYMGMTKRFNHCKNKKTNESFSKNLRDYLNKD